MTAAEDQTKPSARQRRDRSRIFADILGAIVEESHHPGGLRITRVQAKVYVPFDRLKEYLKEMREMGLIETDSLKATARGLKYLEDYLSVRTFFEKFGVG